MPRSPQLLRAVDQEPVICFVLDTALTIVHANPAWETWATIDGATPGNPRALEGRRYLDFVSGPMREQLELRLERALAPEAPPELLLHSECNTPTHFRRLTTHVVPVRGIDESGRARGLVLMHSLELAGKLSERERLAEHPLDHWRRPDGTLVQCGCCRRVQDPRTAHWVMSSQLIASPPGGVSHGLCESCAASYYPPP